METKSVIIRCTSVPQRGDVPAAVEFSAMRPSGVETVGARALGTLLECAGVPSWEADGRTFKITIVEMGWNMSNHLNTLLAAHNTGGSGHASTSCPWCQPAEAWEDAKALAAECELTDEEADD